MRNQLNTVLNVIWYIVFFIAHVVLTVACIKTLTFDYYNPRDLIITYIDILIIAFNTVLLVVIIQVIKLIIGKD